MLREVALRRALEDARNRRQRELDETAERSKALRRRLKELTDRALALGSVHGRFGPVPAEAQGPEAPVAGLIPEAEPPVVAPAPTSPTPATPVFTLAPRREDEHHARLITTLLERFPAGFTVGQMRDVFEEVDPGRPHTYDAAWALANTLIRTRAFELAGTRPGPAGPVRVLRVAPRTDGHPGMEVR